MSNPISSAFFVSSQNIDALDYESGISDKAFTELAKIRPEDPIYETKQGRIMLGPVWNEKGSGILGWGVRVKPENLPKEYYLKGPKRSIADFKKMWNSALVSQKFKDLLESLELETHQFFPVKLLWPDNSSPEGKFYFLNICNNIDSVNQSLSRITPRRKVFSPKFDTEIELSWRPNFDPPNPDKFVLDRRKIGDRHLWVDGYLGGNPRCTDFFRDKCIEEAISGISFASQGLEVA